MEVFHWNSDFETGLSEVDAQHHKLVQITNSLGNLLSNDDVHPKDLEDVFAQLVDYTVYHFTEEEKTMMQFGVDERHIKQHKEIHQTFVQDVLHLKEEFDLQTVTTPKALFDYLMNWLVYHILGSDMSMSRQIEAIKNGYSSAKAFDMEVEKKDKPTHMLLNSLDQLFKQVSQKNKMLKDLNVELEKKVEERTKELSQANERLQKISTTDSLTSLANRRKAMDILEILWDEAQSKELALSCIMIDADNFKQINDTYGHDAGDIVLKELSRELEHAVRTDDTVCRLGGDEFLVICPFTDEEGALNIANIIHQKVNQLKVQAGKGSWKGSISVGIATKDKDMKSINDLIKQADLGVYASKEAGKNCVKRA